VNMSVNNDDISDVVSSSFSRPRDVSLVLLVFVTVVVVVVGCGGWRLPGCSVGGAVAGRSRNDRADEVTLGGQVGREQHLEAREDVGQRVNADQSVVSQSVGRQLVEAQELLLLVGCHLYVWNVQQRLGGANEARHVVLVRKEHSTHGFQQHVLVAVGRST